MKYCVFGEKDYYLFKVMFDNDFVPLSPSTTSNAPTEITIATGYITPNTESSSKTACHRLQSDATNLNQRGVHLRMKMI